MISSWLAHRPTKQAFTLIEVLLVTALFASISLAIFTCLSNGLKLWGRTQKLVIEEDAVIAFDRMALDLRNSFLYSKIPFEGEEYRLAFPTVVWTAADRKSSRAEEGYVDQIGRVRYFFDPGSGKIFRQQANYSQATHGDYSDPVAVVSSVKEMRLRYFYPNQKEEFTHTDSQEKIPSGVEVEIRFSNGEEERILKRFIAIPAGV